MYNIYSTYGQIYMHVYDLKWLWLINANFLERKENERIVWMNLAIVYLLYFISKEISKQKIYMQR